MFVINVAYYCQNMLTNPTLINIAQYETKY